jgi:predicted dehydrogenase
MTSIGVIGAGGWGINHVRVLASEARCTSLHVAEPDPRRHAEIRKIAPGARIVESAEALLDAVAATIIATPASTHAHLAETCLRAGKHVLIEKPLATSLSDAGAVAASARRAGTVAMIGHLMIFHPAVRRLRTLLASGALGEPYYLHATRVNLGKLRTDENALWCFGPHDLSMIDHVLKELPCEVSACGRAVLQRGVEDVVFIVLRFPSGVMANIQLSWLHPRKERRLTLVCSEKMVEFDDVAADKLKIYDKGFDRPPEFKEFGEFLTIRDGDVHIPHIPMVEPLQAQLSHFLDCIATGQEPETNLASALRVTAVLDAAQRSMGAGGVPIPVEPLPGL